MHYVGIDWADASHQIAIMTVDGQCISEFEIQQTNLGFQHLAKQLKPLGPIQVNIERPDGLLVDWLIEQGYPVFVTPPRIAARRRPRRSKDDRGDARLLANLLRTQDEDCRPLERHSSLVEILLQLTRAYAQLQRQQTRVANQLRQVLKHYYPVIPDLFSDIKMNIALAFLQTFPTPQSAQALTLEQLTDFLRTQHYNHMRRVGHIYHQLQTLSPTAMVWQGAEHHALALVPVLQTLNQQIAHLKRKILQTFARHPEAAWWQALPGAGQLTAPRLLALIGDNRAVFPEAEVLQARAGTVPVTRRSGKSRTIGFRWACDKDLRKALMDFAHNSRLESGWAASYYYDQLARGHDKHRATRALANRWARIIWTIWQRRELYDEAVHLANRSHKGRAAVPEPVAAAALPVPA
jgi:transposase